jgi:putative phosphoribosyl transferase
MTSRLKGWTVDFLDRAHAGRLLAERLHEYASEGGVIVLGIPRGGVSVAFEVATALKAPLDVLVLRKLGVPEHEELAFGALASGGVRVLDHDIIGAMGISNADIERITAAEKIELERREQVFRAGRAPLDVAGLTVILVDDGIATGSGMRAAIEALRKMRPARLVIAVPVAPKPVVLRLRGLVDEIVCLEAPETFYGVGQFYGDFSQVSDEEVRGLIERAAHQLGGGKSD